MKFYVKKFNFLPVYTIAQVRTVHIFTITDLFPYRYTWAQITVLNIYYIQQHRILLLLFNVKINERIV